MFLSKTTFMEILYFAIISLILALISLVNFATCTFEFERLLDSYFWFQYILTIILGLVCFFLTVQGQKIRLKRSESIAKILDEMWRFFTLITSKDMLYSQFKSYLVNDNKKRKLEIYRMELRRKRDRTKNEKKRDQFDEKLALASEDVDFQKIKFTEKTIPLLFCGFHLKREEDMLKYSGHEQITGFLLPSLLAGLIITAFTLSFIIGLAEPKLDSVIQLVSRLLTMGVYIFKGITYADYSINTVYKAVLEARRGEVMSFFNEMGYEVQKTTEINEI